MQKSGKKIAAGFRAVEIGRPRHRMKRPAPVFQVRTAMGVERFEKPETAYETLRESCKACNAVRISAAEE